MTAPAHTFGFAQIRDEQDDAVLLDIGVSGAVLAAEIVAGAALTAPSLGQDPGAYPSTAIYPSASLYPGAGQFSGGSILPVNVVVRADLADPGVFDAVLQTT